MLLEDLIKIKNSKYFIEYKNYHKNNIFSITGVARKEELHSNFLSWLLSLNLNDSMDLLPAARFVSMLYIVKERSINKDSRMPSGLSEYDFIFDNCLIKVESKREYYFKDKKSHRFIDIVLHLYLNNNKILPIIIENKVKSSQHDEQTNAYFIWGEKTYSDRSKYEEPLYVFLTPQENNDISEQKEYINIKYQDLVDYVIEPTLSCVKDKDLEFNIRSYLESLTFQSDNEKGGTIMATPKEEKDIIRKFINENYEFVMAVFAEIKKDLPEDAKNSMEVLQKNISYKYLFEGKEVRCGEVVYEIVKKYVDENPGITLDKLNDAFPKSKCKIAGKKGKIAELDSAVSPLDKGLEKGNDGRYHKRYFVDKPLTVKDGQNGPDVEVLVYSQWDFKNAPIFVEYASTEFGYDVVAEKRG